MELNKVDTHKAGTCMCADRECIADHVGADGGHCECGEMTDEQYADAQHDPGRGTL